MAIFGTGSAWIVYNGATQSLDYSVLTPNYQIPDVDEQKSLLTGNRYFNAKGDYSEFDITVYLYKYSNPASASQELYNLNHQNVIFYPHSDGKPIMDASGTEVLFHVNSMKFGYLDNLYYNDVLTMNLKAINYTNLSQSLLITVTEG